MFNSSHAWSKPINTYLENSFCSDNMFVFTILILIYTNMPRALMCRIFFFPKEFMHSYTRTTLFRYSKGYIINLIKFINSTSWGHFIFSLSLNSTNAQTRGSHRNSNELWPIMTHNYHPKL